MAIALGNILTPSSSSSSSSSSIRKTKLSCSFSSHQFIPISNSAKRIQETRLSASIALSRQLEKSLVEESYTSEKNVGFSEKMDSWMQESVVHIVKNLKQSPLLVHVYSENGNVRLRSEKTFPDEWDGVKSEWDNGESEKPDGLIFVEELKQLDDNDYDIVGQDFDEGLARAWGIVVQGKGSECRPACYLLKTNRVCAGIGLGFCTYFCLMRVKSFRDSALQQFQDSWLLN